MANPKTIHQRRRFLEKYGSGPMSYFRREGGIVLGLLTLLIVGAGAFCLSDSSLGIGYFFLLFFSAFALASVGTYLAYHYMLILARKTMASYTDPEAPFHSTFETTNMDRSWNDASIYIPPAAPSPAVTRP
ncbi:hypothetical protein BGX29_000704 [Mortierella sp. GBA35]|nr:hypothetical protein BGX29_000704 [Mortierella sp. GBA35]